MSTRATTCLHRLGVVGRLIRSLWSLFCGSFPKHHSSRISVIVRLLVILGAMIGLAGPVLAKQTIRIATGPEDSVYHIFGRELTLYLQDVLGAQYIFEFYATDGSQHNVQQLLFDGQTKITLCQEDVAHFYYTGQEDRFYFTPGSSEFDIAALGRLFYEEFYVAVEPSIESFEDIDTMFVGLPKSGTYATYVSFERAHEPSWERVNSGDPFRLFRQGRIDAFVDVETSPNQALVDFAESGADFKLLPVSVSDLSLGLAVYHRRVIPDSLSPTGTETETIGIPALLLVSRDLPRQVAEVALRLFYRDAIRTRYFPESSRFLAQIPGHVRELDGTPLPDDARFESLALPLHPAAIRLTLGRFIYVDFILGVLFVVLFWCIWAVLPRRSSRFRYRLLSTSKGRAFYRDIHFLFGALAWGFLAVLGIKAIELGEFLSGKVLSGSPFVQRHLLDTLNWLFVFTTTGFEDHAFPVSPAAKLLAGSVQIVGALFLGYVGVRLLSVFVAKLLEKKDMRDLDGLDGHVVICNWNARGERIIKELRGEDVPAKRRNRKILVIAEAPPAQIPTAKFQDVVHLAEGPWESRTLERGRVRKADSIIVLLPDYPVGSPDRGVVSMGTNGSQSPATQWRSRADGVAMRTAAALKSCLIDCEGNRTSDREPHVVAEFYEKPDQRHLEALNLHSVISVNDAGMNLLAQTVTCQGITAFFDEILMTGRDSNEVYSVDLPKELVGKAAEFQSVLAHFMKKSDSKNPVLPVALRLAIPTAPNALRSDCGTVSHRVFLRPSRATLQTALQDRSSPGMFVEGDQVLVLADEPPAQ